MGNNRPIKKKDWIKFLIAHGCIKKRHNGTSHEHWKCPKCFRTITFRSQYKDIPAMHLQSNLRNMNLTLKDLYKWLENN